MSAARVSCLLLVICTSATALAQTQKPAGTSPPPGYAPAASAAPSGYAPAPSAPPPGRAPPPAAAPSGYPPASPRPGAPAYPYAPPAYPYAPAYAPPPPPPPPPNPAHQRRIGNAHADRVLIAPTAYTHPGGSFYATSYDIALLQLGYALNDSTQISVTGTPPLEGVMPLDFSLKTRLLDERRVRVAVIASATGIVGLNEGDFFLGRGGGVVQLCFDDECKGSFSLGSTLLLAGPASLVASGAGAILPATHWLHLLLEADTLMPIGREAGPYNGVAVGGGARFPFKAWAIDIGALRALGTTSSTATIPMLVFTYRYVP